MTAPVAVTLTSEQLNLQAKARAFAEQEIKPIAAERDAITDPLEAFPWDVWRKGSKLGLRTIALPREHGGEGIDVLTHCVMLEELCVADTAFGGALHQVWKTQKLLLSNDYLKQTYLPKFVADDDYMFCLAFTEPESGTDNILPYDKPDGGSRTRAERDGNGGWIINGRKHFMFAGGIAKGIFVLCRTDPNKGMSDGATLFFLESDAPGFSYSHVFSKMGWRSTPNGELTFEQVRVPDGARVSEVNKALAFIGSFGKPHAPTTAVFGIATARAAFEATLEWCRNQMKDGRPLIEHQATAMRLADMYADIELVRTLTWKAAWSGEYNPDHDVKLGIISQLSTSEMVVRVCSNALPLWGSVAFTKDCPIEKLMRDAYANYHLDGVNDINRIRLTRALAGQAGGGYIG